MYRAFLFQVWFLRKSMETILKTKTLVLSCLVFPHTNTLEMLFQALTSTRQLALELEAS